jgi:hypothetical protein
MSLMDYVAAFFEPFHSHRAPPSDSEERRRRQEQQSRESVAVLRQLRAELALMRRWRNENESGGARAR